MEVDENANELQNANEAEEESDKTLPFSDHEDDDQETQNVSNGFKVPDPISPLASPSPFLNLPGPPQLPSVPTPPNKENETSQGNPLGFAILFNITYLRFISFQDRLHPLIKGCHKGCHKGHRCCHR